jgi:PKD repeat protein
MTLKFIIPSICVASILIASCAKKPKACFSFSKIENVKIGDTITLNNFSENFTDIKWTFPLNAISSTTTPRVKMNTAGTYKVTLTVGEDNFKTTSTVTQSIEVLP